MDHITSFVTSRNRLANILFVSCIQGIGKTRLTKEVISYIRGLEGNKDSVFIGDCNDVKDGSSIMYEPFYEAFCLNGEVCRTDLAETHKFLDRGFFSDRSQLSKGITTLLATAGSFGPVDLSAILSVEDTNSRSIKEISSELVDILIQRFINEKLGQNALTIIIDDFQKCDSATIELFYEILKVLKTRTKYTNSFKFIIVHTPNDGLESEKVANLKEFYIEEMNSMGSKECIENLTLEIRDQEYFVSQILSNTEFRIHPDDGALAFGPFLKGHIENMSLTNEITPGDLFSYLESLENSKYVEFDGSIIRLRNEPEEGELKIHDSRRGLILDSFQALPKEDQSLLESAASIGFKFDAELLAQIWNQDMLYIIGRLEAYEGSLVRDQSNEDNIFSFIDKLTHDVIMNYALKKRGNDETRQLIIEYQKRIIRSIVENYDKEYLEKLDVDILVGATERCFNYSNVEYIRNHTQLIGFEACLKLCQIGKDKKAIELLKKLTDFSVDYSSLDMYKIAQILLELTQVNRDISRFNFQLNDGKIFIDDFYIKCRQKANYYFKEGEYHSNPFNTTSFVLMGGVVDYVQKMRRESVDKKFSIDSSLADPIMKKRFVLVDELSSTPSFTDSWAITRILFYKAILGTDQLLELPLVLKSALSNRYYDLAGEIARHYCLQGISQGQRKELLTMSLDMIRATEESIISLDNYEGDSLTADNIMKGISNVLKSQTFKAKKARDFNILISRVRELMHELGEIENVLILSDLSLNISSKYSDSRGIVLGLSYKANALYNKGLYEESISVYLKYFEFLIRTSRDINDFLYPLEGLLMNSQKTNDSSAYVRCKDELYEHLMYLGSSAITKKLEKSLFNPNNTLSGLFKEIASDYVSVDNLEDESTDDFELIDIVLNLLVGISFADGDLDEMEMYDLRESCIALSRSLNIKQAAVLAHIHDVSSEYVSLNKESRISRFASACEALCVNQERTFILTVLSLCIDMSRADGIVSDSENELIQIAREIFERHA